MRPRGEPQTNSALIARSRAADYIRLLFRLASFTIRLSSLFASSSTMACSPAAHDQEAMKFKVIPNARHSTFIGWLKFFSELFKCWCLRFARHDIVRPFVAPA
jgi:hypothetical protein